MTAAFNPTQSAAALSFAMLSRMHSLVGFDADQVVPRGPVSTLGQRVRDFFRDHPARACVAGALPFDRSAPDFLVSPASTGQAVLDGLKAFSTEAPAWRVTEEPSAAAYAAAVSRALALLAGEGGTPALRKVVLARSLLAVSDRAVDAAGLLQRLHDADASVMAFLVPLPPDADGTPRRLVGATPELLVSRTGRSVASHPLAGSSRRSGDAGEDADARRFLSGSDKDKREHALVVEFILDALAPFCRTLAVPDGTTLRATGTMWHLGTGIAGELRDPETSAADLAAVLHPTPAVCGVPRERAAKLVPELEGRDRGFYAGAVGWCDPAGDGAWHVSIRCAEVAGCRARLYAGAGIVPGSEPEAEVRETAAKFRTMLAALGVEAP